jgi:hypothetical protein
LGWPGPQQAAPSTAQRGTRSVRRRATPPPPSCRSARCRYHSMHRIRAPRKKCSAKLRRRRLHPQSLLHLTSPACHMVTRERSRGHHIVWAKDRVAFTTRRCLAPSGDCLHVHVTRGDAVAGVEGCPYASAAQCPALSPIRSCSPAVARPQSYYAHITGDDVRGLNPSDFVHSISSYLHLNTL